MRPNVLKGDGVTVKSHGRALEGDEEVPNNKGRMITSDLKALKGGAQVFKGGERVLKSKGVSLKSDREIS